jgi:hypothetical protein
MASASVVSQYGPRLDHQQYPHLLNLLDNGHVGAAAESG